MKDLEHKYFKNRESFRVWMEKYHTDSQGLSLVFYKKHTKKKGISYREALEEALCYGWIDSLVKRLDDDKYVRNFTPRTNISNWSDVNKRIVLELIRDGRMKEAGLNKIDVYLEKGRIDWTLDDLNEKSKKEIELPEHMMSILAENEPALTHFLELAPSHKKNYIGWIISAKRDDTQRRRLEEAIALLKEGKKLGMK